MTCGRGGTGRRAALRSLWPKGRGSSSLLDRTNLLRLAENRASFGGPVSCPRTGAVCASAKSRRPPQQGSPTSLRHVAALLEVEIGLGAALVRRAAYVPGHAEEDDAAGAALRQAIAQGRGLEQGDLACAVQHVLAGDQEA